MTAQQAPAQDDVLARMHQTLRDEASAPDDAPDRKSVV